MCILPIQRKYGLVYITKWCHLGVCLKCNSLLNGCSYCWFSNELDIKVQNRWNPFTSKIFIKINVNFWCKREIFYQIRVIRRLVELYTYNQKSTVLLLIFFVPKTMHRKLLKMKTYCISSSVNILSFFVILLLTLLKLNFFKTVFGISQFILYTVE